MAETWFTYPKMVRKDGRTEFVRTPPGLLLSLGDGTAVQIPLLVLADALLEAGWGNMTYPDSAHAVLDRLIQQAQEARDAG